MPQIKSKQIIVSPPILPGDIINLEYLESVLVVADAQSLSIAISIETSNRYSIDNSLSSVISSETSSRISKDTVLSSVISVESVNRINYDNSLSTVISNLNLTSKLNSVGNKNMVARNTTSFDKLACSIPLNNNLPTSSIMVFVNGIQVNLGDDLSCECYFSNDSGVTKKLLNNISSGDLLYWNYDTNGNPLAEYDLSTVDRITFVHLSL